MKKIYLILFALLGTVFSFTSCSKEEPFSTATVDDEPRIIAPTFPERDENGGLGTISEIDRDVLFSITVTTTPADFTSVVWTLDGEEVGTEKTLEMNLNAGVYHLRVDVSTPVGKTTFREGLVKIKALAEDPQSEEKVSERVVTSGSYATISGINLDKVKGIIIKQINKEVSSSKSENSIIEIPESDITVDPSGTYVSFRVPDGISAGTYRIVLVDAEGNEYGANTIEVTQMTIVRALSGNNRPNTEWTLTGLNLNQIASLTVGDETINSFVYQGSSTLKFICPNLEDGEYKLSGKTKDDDNIKFLVGEAMAEEMNVMVEGTVIVTTFPQKLSSGNSFSLIGRNLDLVASISLGTNNVEISDRTSESLSFVCPDLENGEYELSGKDVNGRNVKFKTQEGDLEKIVILVDNSVVETEMWSGHHYLSWDLEDGDPNKTFTAVQTEIQNLPVGTKLKVYYSINPDDDYHKMGAKSAYWNDLPGYGEIEVYDSGVLEIIITQEIIDKLVSESGFIVVGFGVYIDRVTY